MRTEQRPSLQSGHLHIPLTQKAGGGMDNRGNIITEDINPKLKDLISKIKEIISKI